MIGREELQEIEKLGREEPGENTEEFGEEKKRGGSFLPLFQAAICLFLLLGLLVLRFSDREKYSEFSAWYHSEASKEIELPEFRAPEEGTEERGREEEKKAEPSSQGGIIQRASCWNLR